jgi:hypothetical protein
MDKTTDIISHTHPDIITTTACFFGVAAVVLPARKCGGVLYNITTRFSYIKRPHAKKREGEKEGREPQSIVEFFWANIHFAQQPNHTRRLSKKNTGSNTKPQKAVHAVHLHNGTCMCEKERERESKRKKEYNPEDQQRDARSEVLHAAACASVSS